MKGQSVIVTESEACREHEQWCWHSAYEQSGDRVTVHAGEGKASPIKERKAKLFLMKCWK